MKTKIQNLFIALPVLLLLLPAVVQAQNAYSTNADGSIYTYSTNADGSANIVAYAGPPWVVTIPTNINGLTVTSIGQWAFAGDGLTSVTIPGSVTNIGLGPFVQCIGLTAITVDTNNPAYRSANGVLFDKAQATLLQFPGGLGGSYTIPNSVTSIGEDAFEYCHSLTNVTIPGSVTSIGTYAFYYCPGLTSVTIPNSVTNIGDYAFYLCTRLTSVTIPYGVTSIGDYAFTGCGLTSVTIPNSVTNIGYEAFAGCNSLTNVTIPNSVTSIDGTFAGCNSLTSVTIPNSVTNIGGGAFNGCNSLTSVTIPNSVTSIGGGAFGDCSKLTSVTIPNSVTSIGGGAFNGCTSLTNVIIPNNVTSIGGSAFAYCTSLTSVTIPNSVTNIGGSAFQSCSSLTNVTIGNGVTSIGDSAFNNCERLTSVTIGNSVTSIGGGAFDNCNSLTNVTIPNSVTNIGSHAFSDCGLMASVTIGNSVTSIGSYAFSFCPFLTSVYFTGNSPSPNNDSTVFAGAPPNYPNDPATVYYLPGTTGWGALFDGRPTAPWFLPNPLILNNGPGFGVQPGGFGFTISWATNVSVVVEAATNLANPVWIPVSTNPLTNGTNYFSDPQWTNYPERFYRVTSAFTVGGTLTGLPAGDTVTLQDNGSDNLTLSTNGTFTFPTALPDGHAYSVTVSGTSGGMPISCTLANGSGTISGTNVTNVAVQSTYPALTGNRDLDMYNAAVADGTANGGVPAVMFTQNGGPFRVTTYAGLRCSYNVARTYPGWAVFTYVVGTTSCSSTTLPSGTPVIQFGPVADCGFGPYQY